jgi:hypothetical protein
MREVADAGEHCGNAERGSAARRRARPVVARIQELDGQKARNLSRTFEIGRKKRGEVYGLLGDPGADGLCVICG